MRQRSATSSVGQELNARVADLRERVETLEREARRRTIRLDEVKSIHRAVKALEPFVDQVLLMTAPIARGFPDYFTDRELVAALERAVREWERSYEEKGWGMRDVDRGVPSGSVATALAGFSVLRHNGVDSALLPTSGDVIRVGKALGRLARAGFVRNVSRPHQHARWAPKDAS
ncbi:MAG: hypothetical protein ACXVZ1_11245 [Gaiellaceae bacterium]